MPAARAIRYKSALHAKPNALRAFCYYRYCRFRQVYRTSPLPGSVSKKLIKIIRTGTNYSCLRFQE